MDYYMGVGYSIDSQLKTSTNLNTYLVSTVRHWLIYLPGFRHSLIKHFLVEASGLHIFPPNWAWISILLVWVPGPQVTLHGLYSPHLQSTGKETVHYINKKFSRIKFDKCKIEWLLITLHEYIPFLGHSLIKHFLVEAFGSQIFPPNLGSIMILRFWKPSPHVSLHWLQWPNSQSTEKESVQAFNNKFRTKFEKWVNSRPIAYLDKIVYCKSWCQIQILDNFHHFVQP